MSEQKANEKKASEKPERTVPVSVKHYRWMKEQRERDIEDKKRMCAIIIILALILAAETVFILSLI